MSRVIRASDSFEEDVSNQFIWYLEKADEQVAWRFKFSVDQTLIKLSEQSDLGRIRHFRHPKLQGLRSFRIEPPFDRILIFYRTNDASLEIVRLMHGARNLPERLLKHVESE